MRPQVILGGMPIPDRSVVACVQTGLVATFGISAPVGSDTAVLLATFAAIGIAVPMMVVDDKTSFVASLALVLPKGPRNWTLVARETQ